MDIFLICSLCVSACVIMKLLERDNKDMKMLIALAVVIVVFTETVAGLSDATKTLEAMLDEIEIPVQEDSNGIMSAEDIAALFASNSSES